MHGFVGRHRPEGVEVDVDGQEPQHQRQSGQLRLQAHGHQDHERRSHHVLQDLTHRKQSYIQLSKIRTSASAKDSVQQEMSRLSSSAFHSRFTEDHDVNSQFREKKGRIALSLYLSILAFFLAIQSFRFFFSEL